MKLENLGNAFEEVKEIIRQKGAIFARQLKSISQEFDVTEAAIQASFVRETGHSVFDYKIQNTKSALSYSGAPDSKNDTNYSRQGLLENSRRIASEDVCKCYLAQTCVYRHVGF
ncbi:hypothetical protein [Pseudorhodobacter antarcticus]|uniref:hypothetical protein n=1 Tax=Pseudorhodobacter antarcticus TaxID=1077947 RepID=UPI00067DB52F|nr:hypothetical protein [Pseudorhodobacter antarcticus]